MDRTNTFRRPLYIEQERRLSYVGMTRAAEALYLLTVKGEESCFLKELEGKVVLM
jgi:superfamily I DNA/RNA helicase